MVGNYGCWPMDERPVPTQPPSLNPMRQYVHATKTIMPKQKALYPLDRWCAARKRSNPACEIPMDWYSGHRWYEREFNIKSSFLALGEQGAIRAQNIRLLYRRFFLLQFTVPNLHCREQIR